MAIPATLGTSDPTSSQNVANKNNAQLNMEQFMKLLTVQLSNQNPLEPMNDRDFFAQMAQLGQVQGMDKLTSQGEVAQAQSLMGKTVTAVRPLTDSTTGVNSTVTGVVTKLSIRNGQYYLGIQEADGGTVDVQLANLQSIQPNPDATSLSNLIGKTVSGMGTSTDKSGASVATMANGKVLGISADSGVLYVQVQNTDGTLVSVPSTNVSNILG